MGVRRTENEQPPSAEAEKHGHKPKKTEGAHVWPLTAILIAFPTTIIISLACEFLMRRINVWAAIAVILFIIGVSVIADIIGVAFTAAEDKPFVSMAAKKVRGAKQALALIRVANKVASICNDVIGDICGIVSGAAGAVIVVKVLTGTADQAADWSSMALGVLISACIAGFTIGGKAAGKRLGLTRYREIITFVGVAMSYIGWKK